MRFGAGLHGLRDLIGGSLKALDLEVRVKEQACLLVWDEVVGEQVSGAAQPEFVKDGRLFVVTKSAVWANELTFYKSDMISRLNKRVGAKVLKDIVFKIGRVTRTRRAGSRTRATESLDLEGIQLTDAELQEVDAAASEAAPEMADRVRSLLETAVRVDKWKRSRGWSSCKRCGALQDSPAGMCPPCRIEGK